MLFGHQNNDDKPAENNPVVNDVQAPSAATVQPSASVNPLAVDPDTGISLPAEVLDDMTAPSSDLASAAAVTSDDNIVPAPTASAPVTSDDDLLIPNSDDDLLALKQNALQELGPLVDHLDQTPEEKFRTTMMMIQSSDNKGLIKVAYEAAQKIGDQKIRAQALLDIVNEINYFTQQSNT